LVIDEIVIFDYRKWESSTWSNNSNLSNLWWSAFNWSDWFRDPRTESNRLIRVCIDFGLWIPELIWNLNKLKQMLIEYSESKFFFRYELTLHCPLKIITRNYVKITKYSKVKILEKKIEEDPWRPWRQRNDLRVCMSLT